MRARIFFAVLTACAVRGFAQYPEDALRLASPGIGIGPRAVGMGSAFVPIADDYSALFWNPAGLGQLRNREITVGLSNVHYGDNASFLGTTTPSSVNSLQLDDIGGVFPVERRHGGFALAIGYNRIGNFSGIASFDAVNPVSSIIGFEVNQARASKVDPTTTIPFQTGVAGIVNGVLTTPVNKGLDQSGTITEDGGLHALSLGAGFEIADGLDVGVALHFYTGSYSYERQYRETDVNNIYNAQDTATWSNVDLYQYAQNDVIDATITGIGANIGMLYHWQDLASMGVTVTVPSSFHVHEDYAQTGQASFDNNDLTSKITQSGTDEYDVTTPLTLSGGVAVQPIKFFTLSGSVDYIDYTQLRFSNADPSVMDFNSSMRTTFRPVLNYHAGAEYKFAELGLGVRGGYQFLESAYAVDPSSEGQKILSAGVSFVLAKQAVLEFAFGHGSTKAYHTNYDPTSATTETVAINYFLLGFSYRY